MQPVPASPSSRQCARLDELIHSIVVARWTLLTVAVTAVTVLGSPGGLGAQEQPLITPEAARRELRVYERANQRNNARLGVEGQSAIESPPIQLIDDATFRELRNRDSMLGPQGVVVERAAFVPLQTTYPLQFVSSQVLDFGDSAQSRQLLVFDRPTEDDDWKVTTAAQLDGSATPELLVDDEGWAARLEPADAAQLKLAPEAIAPALAELWTRSDEGVDVTSDLFERGEHTTGAVEARVGELGSTGIQGDVSFEFAAAPYPVVSYRLTRGRALTFFAVASTETITPTDGARWLVQPGSRTTFGGLVVRGRHRSVQYQRLDLLAAVIPRAGSPGRVRVIGSYAGTIDAFVDSDVPRALAVSAL